MIIEPISLDIPGCYSVSLSRLHDERGSFFKLFRESWVERLLTGFFPREIYLTSSSRGVLRGMHFQVPPFDHSKIIICLSGRVTDVLLDLRSGPGYGAFTSLELSTQGTNAVLIPKGVAHGFYAHEDDSSLLYLVETEYRPGSDRGVMWNSFGFEWPSNNPIISQRDTCHPDLLAFSPPLEWQL